MQVAGVGLDCKGYWSVAGWDLSGGGGLDATVSDTSMSLGIDFVMGSNGVINYTNATDCKTTIVFDATFEGSGIIEKVAEWFFPYIKGYIKTYVEGFACTELRTVIYTNLTSVFASVNDQILPYMKTPPVLVMPLLGTDAVVLQNNSLIKLANFVLNDVVGANGDLGINKIVNNFTDNTGNISVDPSTIRWIETELGLTSFIPTSWMIDLGGLAEMGIQFDSVNIWGLNTWKELLFFDAVGPHMLETTAALDRFGFNLTLSINVTTTMTKMEGDQAVQVSKTLKETFSLIVDMNSNTFNLTQLIGFNGTWANLLFPMQFLSPGCVLPSLSNYNTTGLSFEGEVSDVKLEASRGDIERKFDEFVSAVLGMFTKSYSGVVPAFFDGVFDGPIRTMSNSAIDSLVHDNIYMCSTVYPKDNATISVPITTYSFSVAGGIGIIIALLIAFAQFGLFDVRLTEKEKKKIKKMEKKRRKKEKKERKKLMRRGAERIDVVDGGRGGMGQSESSLLVSSVPPPQYEFSGVQMLEDNTTPIYDPYATDTPKDNMMIGGGGINESPKGDWGPTKQDETPEPARGFFGCLALDPSIPSFFRYIIPLFIFLNIALFITSNTGIGASVFVRITLGTKVMWLPSLFDFTLASSVRDMWDSGVYPLSLLVAVFTGAWPYLKLLLLLFVWFMPLTYFEARKREIVVMVVDALGKWSLLDSYVMVLMLTSFRVSMVPPKSPDSKLDIFVVPGWGFYTFLMATVLSLLLTHLVLAFHRQSQKPDRWDVAKEWLEKNGAYGKRRILCRKAFRGSCGDRCNIFGPFFIVLLLATSLVLTAIGSYFKAFDFVIGGLTGFILSYLNASPVSEYSLISLGIAVSEAYYEPNFVGIRIIQTSFFLFSLGIPVLHLLVMLLLWTCPLSPTAQKRIFKATEILNAWSALDVFVLSLLVSLVELNQLALFIVGDKCNPINEILVKYFSNVIPDGEDTCFQVHATLSDGCWLLFGATLCYIIASIAVMKTCHQTLLKQQEKFEHIVVKNYDQIYPEDTKPSNGHSHHHDDLVTHM